MKNKKMSEQKTTITKKEVEKIAKLARLELTEAEKEKFAPQLSSILSYVNELQEVNTENVEPTSQVTGLKNIAREDVADQCEIQNKLIDCAPEKDGRLVKVKNVL